MIPLISIYLGGFLTLVIAVMHTKFYKIFKWGTCFDKISTINARIIYTIHLALLLLFFMIGVITIIYAEELSRSDGLALGFNISYAVFWMWRLIWQIVYFKKGEGQKIPPIGIFFTLVFLLLVVSYSIPVIWIFL
jgi:hypothetical protein